MTRKTAATKRREAGPIRYAVARCRFGRLLVAATGLGICQVRVGEVEQELEETLRREFPFAVLEKDASALAPWTDRLVGYAEGASSRPELPLDVPSSRLHRRVFEGLRTIERCRAHAPS